MPVDCKSCDLLRAISRRRDDTPARQLGQLASEIGDWSSLLKLAREHRVLPMLFLRLDEMGPAVPKEARDVLLAEYQRNVFHSVANAAELISVLAAFDREMIPAMPFKGVVLGASVYRNPMTRAAGDLDVLIHLRDLPRATAILQERGYELKTAVHADGTPAAEDYHEYHFDRRADGMVLELRWRLELTQSRFRHDLGMDWVWPRRRTAMLAGAKVPDMNPEIKLLVLCMHGSKHVWTRLMWIFDVAELLTACPDLDWKEVRLEAKRSGLWRSLALGVLLAYRIAGAPVPKAVLERFEADRVARNLAEHIEAHLFDAPGSTPESGLPYSLQLLGFSDRSSLLISLKFLRPNERDRAFLPLPKSLQFLYYLVRPLRILRDKSAR
jgi:hypothetical protein